MAYMISIDFLSWEIHEHNLGVHRMHQFMMSISFGQPWNHNETQEYHWLCASKMFVTPPYTASSEHSLCSHLYIFEMDRRAFGSTPTSGRAVQQKVEGRFNHGVNFFDAFCHQDGVSLFVWTQQLHHIMTSCAQSTFTFLSATLCNALLLESVPATVFVEHKPLGAACSNSMPGTAGTVQPLDWTFTWNAICAEQVWSWIRHESRSLALTACKLVLFWGTLRESIFHCLRHVLASSIC